MSEGLDYLA